MGWTMPLQHAAYRGVRFDVISVTDNIERIFVEHAYPFVDGADLEDMGQQPRQVQLQAVFFGKGYRIGLDKFMMALQQSGADVLVHPIFGRMQNMLCTSASIRHGDEFVDYATLDLTFIEATQIKPLFTLEQGIWGEVDRLLNELEAFEEKAVALYGQFMHTIAYAQYTKTRLLNVWSALSAMYESTLSLFGADPQKYSISAGISLANFESGAMRALKEMSEMIHHGLMRKGFPLMKHAISDKPHPYATPLFEQAATQVGTVFTVSSSFNEVLREIAQLKRLPHELVSGKNNSVKRAAKLAALISTFSEADMRETACMVQVICTIALLRIGIELIEAHVETLLPSEIEYIAQQIRLMIAETLSAVRILQQQDLTEQGNQMQQNTGIYPQTYETIESLRQFAHQVSRIVLIAINRKPPLMVKASPLTGTIQQIAHAFYGDYTRADELLRLNPQIRRPYFISQGEWMNAYSK